MCTVSSPLFFNQILMKRGMNDMRALFCGLPSGFRIFAYIVLTSEKIIVIKKNENNTGN